MDNETQQGIVDSFDKAHPDLIAQDITPVEIDKAQGCAWAQEVDVANGGYHALAVMLEKFMAPQKDGRHDPVRYGLLSHTSLVDGRVTYYAFLPGEGPRQEEAPSPPPPPSL